ncbi:hypothetical protein A167_00708 [Alcanivorax sp. S71-1-4]|nr:GpE family phage tail protein [Alcanivorax sp. S71-1-4]KAF0810428.1 hypothetical protein A167_00708 [Alcanivorax sp. S71-1-4]
MANIAAIFHWPPPVMDVMSVTELMAWQEEARRRSGSDK